MPIKVKKPVWERLHGDALEPASTFRAKVPGGWLVYVCTDFEGKVHGGLTFYPDPAHTWKGGSD